MHLFSWIWAELVPFIVFSLSFSSSLVSANDLSSYIILALVGLYCEKIHHILVIENVYTRVVFYFFLFVSDSYHILVSS